jgi:hypothetical protein
LNCTRKDFRLYVLVGGVEFHIHAVNKQGVQAVIFVGWFLKNGILKIAVIRVLSGSTGVCL